MTLDVFLKLGDIAGDSADAAHRDEVVVLSWEWGLTAIAPPIGSGGGGASASSKIEFRRLRFAHRIDCASPLIMLACASGKRIKDATLTVRRPGAAGFEFLIVKLSDVTVASVESAINGDRGDDLEWVCIDCAKVDLQYIPQDANGAPGAPVRFGWDIRSNKPLA